MVQKAQNTNSIRNSCLPNNGDYFTISKRDASQNKETIKITQLPIYLDSWNPNSIYLVDMNVL